MKCRNGHETSAAGASEFCEVCGQPAAPLSPETKPGAPWRLLVDVAIVLGVVCVLGYVAFLLLSRGGGPVNGSAATYQEFYASFPTDWKCTAQNDDPGDVVGVYCTLDSIGVSPYDGATVLKFSDVGKGLKNTALMGVYWTSPESSFGKETAGVVCQATSGNTFVPFDDGVPPRDEVEALFKGTVEWSGDCD